MESVKNKNIFEFEKYENFERYKKESFIFTNVYGVGSNSVLKTNPYDEVDIKLTEFGDAIDIKPGSVFKLNVLSIPNNVVEHNFQLNNSISEIKRFSQDFDLKNTITTTTTTTTLKDNGKELSFFLEDWSLKLCGVTLHRLYKFLPNISSPQPRRDKSDTNDGGGGGGDGGGVEEHLNFFTAMDKNKKLILNVQNGEPFKKSILATSSSSSSSSVNYDGKDDGNNVDDEKIFFESNLTNFFNLPLTTESYTHFDDQHDQWTTNKNSHIKLQWRRIAAAEDNDDDDDVNTKLSKTKKYDKVEFNDVFKMLKVGGDEYVTTLKKNIFSKICLVNPGNDDDDDQMVLKIDVVDENKFQFMTDTKFILKSYFETPQQGSFLSLKTKDKILYTCIIFNKERSVAQLLPSREDFLSFKSIARGGVSSINAKKAVEALKNYCTQIFTKFTNSNFNWSPIFNYRVLTIDDDDAKLKGRTLEEALNDEFKKELKLLQDLVDLNEKSVYDTVNRPYFVFYFIPLFTERNLCGYKIRRVNLFDVRGSTILIPTIFKDDVLQFFNDGDYTETKFKNKKQFSIHHLFKAMDSNSYLHNPVRPCNVETVNSGGGGGGGGGSIECCVNNFSSSFSSSALDFEEEKDFFLKSFAKIYLEDVEQQQENYTDKRYLHSQMMSHFSLITLTNIDSNMKLKSNKVVKINNNNKPHIYLPFYNNWLYETKSYEIVFPDRWKKFIFNKNNPKLMFPYQSPTITALSTRNFDGITAFFDVFLNRYQHTPSSSYNSNNFKIINTLKTSYNFWNGIPGLSNYVDQFLNNLEVRCFTNITEDILFLTDGIHSPYISTFTIPKQMRKQSRLNDYYHTIFFDKTNYRKIINDCANSIRLICSRYNGSLIGQYQYGDKFTQEFLPFKIISFDILSPIKNNNNNNNGGRRRNKSMRIKRKFIEFSMRSDEADTNNNDIMFSSKSSQHVSMLKNEIEKFINPKVRLRVKSLFMPINIKNNDKTNMVMVTSSIADNTSFYVNNKKFNCLAYLYHNEIPNFEFRHKRNETIQVEFTNSLKWGGSIDFDFVNIDQLNRFRVQFVDENDALIEFKNTKLPIALHFEMLISEHSDLKRKIYK
jgi:hypothetical protein